MEFIFGAFVAGTYSILRLAAKRASEREKLIAEFLKERK